MKASARVQAAIELLDEIIVAARDAGPAADTIVQDFFKRRRYAGSGDRRAIRELVYRVIRRSGEPPVSGRAAMIGLGQDDPELLKLFDWTVRAPAPPLPNEPVAEAATVPAWLLPELDPLVGADERDALLDRAPLDVRVNRLKGDRAAAAEAIPEAEPTPWSPIGLRLPDGFALDAHPAWQSGLVEVQDEGSQLIGLACGVAPDMVAVDLCAGAGGKTLAFAADMANRGRLVASDTDRGRLSRIAPRAQRAGATAIECRLVNPRQELKALADLEGKADVVLVDAPCSGSGTWRRNPETRWRLKPERLRQIVAVQSHLIDIAAQLVRPGGRVIYAVCSLLAVEGRAQAEAFAARRSSFIPEDPPIEGGRACGLGRLLTPGHDHTDGFFIARWQAPC